MADKTCKTSERNTAYNAQIAIFSENARKAQNAKGEKVVKKILPISIVGVVPSRTGYQETFELRRIKSRGEWRSVYRRAPKSYIPAP